MKLLSAIPGVAQARAAWAAGKAWVWVGCALAVLMFGFWAGNRWAAGDVAKAEAKVEKIAGERDAWKNASAGWQLAAERWAARFKADEEAAADRAKQATRILGELSRDKAEADRKAREWQRQYEAGVTSPDCLQLAKLVKESKCAVFRRSY